MLLGDKADILVSRLDKYTYTKTTTYKYNFDATTRLVVGTTHFALRRMPHTAELTLFTTPTTSSKQFDQSCVRRSTNQKIASFSRRSDINLIHLASGDPPLKSLRAYKASCRSKSLPSVAPCHSADDTPSDLSRPSTHDFKTRPATRQTFGYFAGTSPNNAFHASLTRQSQSTTQSLHPASYRIPQLAIITLHHLTLRHLADNCSSSIAACTSPSMLISAARSSSS